MATKETEFIKQKIALERSRIYYFRHLISYEQTGKFRFEFSNMSSVLDLSSELSSAVCCMSYIEVDNNELVMSWVQCFENLIEQGIKYPFYHGLLSHFYLYYGITLYILKNLIKAIECFHRAHYLVPETNHCLNEEELILTKFNTIFEKNCSSWLQMSSNAVGSPEKALYVSEELKFKCFSLVLGTDSDFLKSYSFESIENIISKLKTGIILFSFVYDLLFCWLILPDTNDPYKLLIFDVKSDIITLAGPVENGPISRGIWLLIIGLHELRTFPSISHQSRLQINGNFRDFEDIFKTFEFELVDR